MGIKTCCCCFRYQCGACGLSLSTEALTFLYFKSQIYPNLTNHQLFSPPTSVTHYENIGLEKKLCVSKHIFGIAGEKKKTGACFIFIDAIIDRLSPRMLDPPGGSWCAAAPDPRLQPLEREPTGEDGS